MPSGRGEEARRSARVATSFLVAVDGVDDEPVSRRGDISATGIYFETDKFVGSVGSVQYLIVRSSNRTREIRLAAHLVRSVTLEALGGRARYGVAFEFMPSSPERALEVERFVQYVLLVVDDGSEQEPQLTPRLAAMSLAAEARPNSSAVIRQLSVRAMTLEANWSVNQGERVRVEIAAQGMRRRVRLEGAAVRVTPLGRAAEEPPFEIEVQFQSEVDRPPRSSSSSMTFSAVRPELIAAAREAAAAPRALPRLDEPLENEDHEVSNVLDELFSSLIHPGPEARSQRDQLSGTLSRVRLPTLFAIFEMERLTGELALQRGTERVVVYVRDGQLVDVVPTPDATTPRAQIGRLVEWNDATFEFSVCSVDRPDRIGLSMTALFLDLAREADEAKRPPEA
jgi:hypothetical protein